MKKLYVLFAITLLVLFAGCSRQPASWKGPPPTEADARQFFEQEIVGKANRQVDAQTKRLQDEMRISQSVPNPTARASAAQLNQYALQQVGLSRQELVSFKKTDGQWGEKDGIPFYRLAYVAQVRQVSAPAPTPWQGWIRFEKTERGWYAKMERQE